MFLAAAGGCGAWLYATSRRPPLASVEVVTANEVATDFSRNVLAAETRYREKWWRVQAYLGSVTRAPDESNTSVDLPVALLDGRPTRVACELDSDSDRDVINLRRGQMVEMMGVGDFYHRGMPLFRRCAVVRVGPVPPDEPKAAR